ncbi:unnamed protein product [Caenorhabditis brenneri]
MLKKKENALTMDDSKPNHIYNVPLDILPDIFQYLELSELLAYGSASKSTNDQVRLGQSRKYEINIACTSNDVLVNTPRGYSRRRRTLSNDGNQPGPAFIFEKIKAISLIHQTVVTCATVPNKLPLGKHSARNSHNKNKAQSQRHSK